MPEIKITLFVDSFPSKKSLHLKQISKRSMVHSRVNDIQHHRIWEATLSIASNRISA